QARAGARSAPPGGGGGLHGSGAGVVGRGARDAPCARGARGGAAEAVMRVRVAITRAGEVEGPAPRYQTEGAAGMDLHAAVAAPVTIAPGARALVPVGWAVAIPPGYEGQVRPRSGLALKHGVTVLNAPGTVDADYR